MEFHTPESNTEEHTKFCHISCGQWRVVTVEINVRSVIWHVGFVLPRVEYLGVLLFYSFTKIQAVLHAQTLYNHNF